jgi:hypothetical protein
VEKEDERHRAVRGIHLEARHRQRSRRERERAPKRLNDAADASRGGRSCAKRIPAMRARRSGSAGVFDEDTDPFLLLGDLSKRTKTVSGGIHSGRGGELI